MFWPAELSEEEADRSVIPKLLESQDQFISILSIDLPDFNEIFKIVEVSNLTANLFLKHLSVIADVGGETLMRINSQFDQLFPYKVMDYIYRGESYSYKFKALPITGTLNNDKLGISGKKLLERQNFSDLTKEVSRILMFGSLCTNEDTATIISKCEIGSYLGLPEELARFIKQRYIWVSRITGGEKANTLGQIAEKFVGQYIKDNLGLPGIEIKSGYLPSVYEGEDKSAKFDLVVTNGEKYAAVEVSFQVTTNSTIERKAGQAKSRYEQIEKAGHKIAYVIDGAGNLRQRTRAVGVLCSYSHCTVAFSKAELGILCEFLKAYFTKNNRRGSKGGTPFRK
ncbi:MAG: restriction endonuclease [Deltaproteobacteria bacterium]|nr:restriction endonuclease [Deltaproteobacteria bacterium]